MPKRPLRNSTINNPIYEKLVAVISKARKAADLNQQELADLVGILQPHISQIEQCQRRVDVLELLNIIDAITNGNKKQANILWQEIQSEYYKNRKPKK